MPRAASRVHRALSRALLVALLSTSGVGCLVSFDGYSYDESEGNGEGGSSAGGSSAGGSGEAGAGGGDAGQGGAVAGQSGSSGQAGSSAGGVSGAGGNAGISGSSGQGGDGGVAGDAGSAGEGGGGGDAGSTGSAGDSGAGQGGAGNSGSAGDGGAAGDGGGGSGGNAGDGGSSVGGAGASGQGGAGQGGAGNGGAGQGGAGNGGAGQGGTGQAGSGNGGAGQGGAGMSGASGQGGAGAGQGGASGSAGQGGAGQGGAGQGGNAGSGGSAGAPFECPVNLPKPSMIEVSAPDGYVYCIDRTEVTNEQYKTFLDANVPTSGQPAFCSWNQNYAPEQSGGCSTGTFPYDPGPAGKNRAVACVDWCDAYAYCEWAGKRLCGNIEGGVNAMASYADPGKSAWYNACSLGGTMELPYGDQYLSGYCNDILSGSSGPENVTSFTACEGGVNGLYHMVGNVAEWEDSCSGQSAASDLCLARGGGFLSSDNASKEAATCDSSKVGGAPIALPPQKQRNARARDIGFRCCYP